MADKRIQNRKKLQVCLRQLFQFGSADLDFSIYRIMHQKREEIERFIEHDLLDAVKGAGSEAQAWRNRRAALAENGFTFEYSATFGQGVGGAGADIEEEYGRAILFDYSYPRFYEDGYGKDYRILNLEHDLDPTLTNRYLLANLLTFYEQARCYAANQRIFYNGYNVEPPLLVFIGHTVTARKTWSGLGETDRRSLSDVQELVLFLHRVLRNEGGWAPAAIDDILSGKAGLEREDGSDLFADAFRTLRKDHLDGATIYADMLRHIFHVTASAGLHLVNLKSAEGEIGLRAGVADRLFGLINIGDDANFLRLAEEKTPQIAIEEEEQFSILRPEEGYRERCRRRLGALGLEDEVCGICVRVCWEAVVELT